VTAFRTRLALLAAAAAIAAPARAADEKIMLWVERLTDSHDCALHTEVTVNGKSLGNFTATKQVDVTGVVKPGLNAIAFATTPHEPASFDNHLDFTLGPVTTNPRTKKTVMKPALLLYRSNQDWKLNDDAGTYSHPFGPNPKTPAKKTVTHTYNFYYAGSGPDLAAPKEGDFVLQAESINGRNPSVLATVSVNGKAVGSFHGPARSLVVTDLLKPGENEVRLTTEAVANQLYHNDTRFEILGPMTYSTAKERFLGKPVLRFNAMEGWTQDRTTGVVHVKGKPGVTTYERVIKFNVETMSK
jgi:hypothetical protein